MNGAEIKMATQYKACMADEKAGRVGWLMSFPVNDGILTRLPNPHPPRAGEALRNGKSPASR
jgi:hypothetical protein